MDFYNQKSNNTDGGSINQLLYAEDDSQQQPDSENVASFFIPHYLVVDVWETEFLRSFGGLPCVGSRQQNVKRLLPVERTFM
jgi:hypothetical protein